MLRLGLCCKFFREPIAFKDATAAALARLPRDRQLAKLSQLALANAASLRQALAYCATHGIGCFRVSSRILPLQTHPAVGYAVAELPDAEAIATAFVSCGAFARERGLRLTFHPDQFILLSALDPEIIRKSVLDLECQATVAAWIGADVINVHAGGAYGDKAAALRRLTASLRALPPAVRTRLTLEKTEKGARGECF